MSLLLRTAAAAFLTAALSSALSAQEATPAPTPVPSAAPAETPAADAPARDVAADTVLAMVNGEPITVGNVIALVADLPEQYQQLPDDVLYSGVLEQMVQQMVLAGTFKDPTASEMLTLQNQDRAVKAGLAVQRILAADVSDVELQAAYDKMFAGAEPKQEYHAAHILVATEDEAKAIEEQLKAGGDFAAIAREKSQDPGSGAAGGDLGWFGEGMMVPEFETAVKALKPGETSAPVKSQFGWHVIRLEEVRTVEKPTLDEMREQLTEQVKNEKVEAAIAAATESATIDRSGSEGIDPSVIRKTELLGD